MQRLLALAAVPWIGVFNLSVSGGTRVTVDEGIVRVRDRIRARNHLLHAGQTFLVRTSGPNRGQ